jgi:hypothetical protein
MRALRKGQAAAFNITRDIRGEAHTGHQRETRELGQDHPGSDINCDLTN